MVRRNKAVANGAVAFYLGNVVSSRVSRMTYGTKAIVDYKESLKAHFQRRDRVRVDTLTGLRVLHDSFDVILSEVRTGLAPEDACYRFTDKPFFRTRG